MEDQNINEDLQVLLSEQQAGGFLEADQERAVWLDKFQKFSLKVDRTLQAVDGFSRFVHVEQAVSVWITELLLKLRACSINNARREAIVGLLSKRLDEIKTAAQILENSADYQRFIFHHLMEQAEKLLEETPHEPWSERFENIKKRTRVFFLKNQYCIQNISLMISISTTIYFWYINDKPITQFLP